jgi:hypothetical protein
MGATSHPGESPSLLDTSTQYSTAAAGTANTCFYPVHNCFDMDHGKVISVLNHAVKRHVPNMP